MTRYEETAGHHIFPAKTSGSGAAWRRVRTPQAEASSAIRGQQLTDLTVPLSWCVRSAPRRPPGLGLRITKPTELRGCLAYTSADAILLLFYPTDLYRAAQPRITLNDKTL